MSEEEREEDGCVIRYKGGKVLKQCGDEVKLELDDVWVRNGKVIDPKKLFYDEKKLPDKVVDCSRLIVAPGFIDIQINGAFGVDFSSLKRDSVCEEISKVSKGLLTHGVTAYCPTIVTSPSEYYKDVLAGFNVQKSGLNSSNEALVLGVHLEGPFISPEKKGAHHEEFIVSSLSPQLVQELYGTTEGIKIVTLAPELRGAEKTIKWLREEKGIVVSLGHSMAKLETAERAVKSGASLVTHLFNAMLPFHHRDPGIVGLLTSLQLDNRDVFYGIIADGFHTHETVQRISYHANRNGIVLVTDAIAAMGLPDGEHRLGQMTVDVKDGAARLTGKHTLAGSVATMDKCVCQFRQATDCSKAEALAAASLHPAQVLGIADRKGTLKYGADADMVLLNEKDMCVVATCIGGRVVWSRPGWQD